MVARVMEELTSLWVRIMRNIYFSNGEFLSAIKGSRASWGGQAYLRGEALLKGKGFGESGMTRTFMSTRTHRFIQKQVIEWMRHPQETLI